MTIQLEQLKRPRIQPHAFAVKSAFNPFDNGMNLDLLSTIQWAILNIGTIESARWEIRFSATNKMTIYFKRKEDAMAFKLRWK